MPRPSRSGSPVVLTGRARETPCSISSSPATWLTIRRVSKTSAAAPLRVSRTASADVCHGPSLLTSEPPDADGVSYAASAIR